MHHLFLHAEMRCQNSPAQHILQGNSNTAFVPNILRHINKELYSILIMYISDVDKTWKMPTVHSQKLIIMHYIEVALGDVLSTEM